MSLQDAANVISYLEARRTILQDPTLTPFGQGQMLFAVEQAREVAPKPNSLTPGDLLVGAVQAGLGYGIGTLAAKFLGAGPQATANIQSGGFGLGSLLGMGLIKKAGNYDAPVDTSGAPINSATGQPWKTVDNFRGQRGYQAEPTPVAKAAPAPAATPGRLASSYAGSSQSLGKVSPLDAVGFNRNSGEEYQQKPTIDLGRRVGPSAGPSHSMAKADGIDYKVGDGQWQNKPAVASAAPTRASVGVLAPKGRSQGINYAIGDGPQQNFSTPAMSQPRASEMIAAKTSPQAFNPAASQKSLAAQPPIPPAATQTVAKVDPPVLPTASSIAPTATPKPVVAPTAAPGAAATAQAPAPSEPAPTMGTSAAPAAPAASQPSGPVDMGNAASTLKKASENDRRYAFRLGFVKRALALGLLDDTPEAKVALQLMPLPTLPLTPETFAAPIRGTMNAFSTAARGTGSLLGNLDSMDSTDKSVMRMEAETSALRRQEEELKARRANRIVGALLARRKNPPAGELASADPVQSVQSA